jgi:hypothetical protein
MKKSPTEYKFVNQNPAKNRRVYMSAGSVPDAKYYKKYYETIFHKLQFEILKYNKKYYIVKI